MNDDDETMMAHKCLENSMFSSIFVVKAICGCRRLFVVETKIQIISRSNFQEPKSHRLHLSLSLSIYLVSVAVISFPDCYYCCCRRCCDENVVFCKEIEAEKIAMSTLWKLIAHSILSPSIPLRMACLSLSLSVWINICI